MRSWCYFLVALLFCLPLGRLSAQDLEDGSRFVLEKDWVSWKKGIVMPDTVKKLLVDEDDDFSLAKLAEFKNLRGLVLSDHELADLGWLAQFPKLKVLELSGNGLRSLEGIQALKSLEEFSISSNFISNLTPLDSMQGLKMLKLYDNDIADLSGIAHLKNVVNLDVSINPISSLEPIAHWEHLRSFAAYRCSELHDLRPVFGWLGLRDLNISFLDVPDFSLEQLGTLMELVNLRVQGMVKSNRDLGYLKAHANLEQLTMGKNDSVTSIDSLWALGNLRYLDIHSNNVSDISVVRNFPRMVKVVMYRNHVTDISPFLSCPELRALYIHENPIKDYSPVFQMGYLQYLNISAKAFDATQKQQLQKARREVAISFM